jgi:hypothetical protein
MQTIERASQPVVAPRRASRSETLAASVREMSRNELAERLRSARDSSSADIVRRQESERRRRAEAAAARLKSA